MNQNWEKYGFSLIDLKTSLSVERGYYIYSNEEIGDYNEKVAICHDMVSSYLDCHPEIEFRKPGFRYFDILRMVSPKMYHWANRWSKEHDRRRKELEAERKAMKHIILPLDVKRK